MKKINFLLATILASFTMAQSPGDVINYKQNLNLTPSGVVDFIDQNVGEDAAGALSYLKSFNIGIVAYKIEYYTKNQNNQLVKATGLLMYPKKDIKHSTIVTTHPTTDHRSNVPSNLRGIYGVGFALELSFVLNGYIVMAPDYVGMGDGEGVHPYVHNDTEGTATLDFITAANKVIDKIGGIKRYNEYFITGYSQGGHAAMATVKRATETNGLKFNYLYTGAGPFDLSYSTLKLGLLDKTLYPTSAIPAYLVNTCKMTGFNVYNQDASEIISPEYLSIYKERVENEGGGLFWGPVEWRKLFKNQFINDVTNNQNHALRNCLKANNNYDWYNKTPSTFGYADPDFIVNANSSKVAKDVQRKYYPWYDLGKYKIDNLYWGPLGHVGGIVPYILAVNYKFNTLRSGGFFNQWALLNFKNENEQPVTNNFVKSAIDFSFPNDLQILEIVDYNQEKTTTKKAAQNNEINSLQDGVYTFKVLVDNQEQIIPFVKKTPEMIDYNEAVKSDKNNILTLNLNAEDLNQVNILDQNNKIVHSISQEQYKSDKGVDVSNFLNDDYTYEIVTKEFIVSFKKPQQDSLVKEDLQVYTNNNQIHASSNSTISTANVMDMNGRIIWSKERINDKNISTTNLPKGIYIIQLINDKGETFSKKVIL